MVTVKNLEIFKGKKVLITGHTGFKGSWLAVWLEMLGARVSGIALDPVSENGLFIRSGIGQLIDDHRGDIRDLGYLNRVISGIEPDVIFHLAAQPLVLESYRDPVSTFMTNVIGTVNVLEAIRHCPSVKAAVIITTDKVYKNREWIWGYRESDSLGGHDPYSSSKSAAELIISSYRSSFFSGKNATAIASARAGNIIGGGDWAEHRLVPDIIRAIKSDKVIEVRNPNSVRPWQFVLEPLGGYLLLAEKLISEPLEYSEPWNFGPLVSDSRTVKDVTEKVIAYAGKGGWKDISLDEKLHETGRLILDSSKAIQRLGWQSFLTFEDRIKYTVDWYMAESTGILEFTRKQITEYQERWSLLKEK